MAPFLTVLLKVEKQTSKRLWMYEKYYFHSYIRIDMTFI